MHSKKTKEIAMQNCVTICLCSAFAYGLYVASLYFMYLMSKLVSVLKTAPEPMISNDIKFWIVWFFLAIGVIAAVPFAKFVYKWELRKAHNKAMNAFAKPMG